MSMFGGNLRLFMVVKIFIAASLPLLCNISVEQISKNRVEITITHWNIALAQKDVAGRVKLLDHFCFFLHF